MLDSRPQPAEHTFRFSKVCGRFKLTVPPSYTRIPGFRLYTRDCVGICANDTGRLVFDCHTRVHKSERLKMVARSQDYTLSQQVPFSLYSSNLSPGPRMSAAEQSDMVE